jgi:hypothetical protein
MALVTPSRTAKFVDEQQSLGYDYESFVPVSASPSNNSLSISAKRVLGNTNFCCTEAILDSRITPDQALQHSRYARRCFTY